MNILGLVTEYNPFHNGHLHHLRESQKISDADLTVAVMSGHLLQRGLPALIDKWTRAQMAVESGVDLIVELPTVFSCSSAESFAKGSMLLLHSLGAQTVCFGSESGAIAPFMSAAKILCEESPLFKATLREHLNSGISFPDARSRALHETLPKSLHISNAPNNTLGIEYCKAILAENLPLNAVTIPRVAADYHSTEISGSICSATAIRKLVTDSPLPDFHSVMPPTAAALMDEAFRSGRVASEDRWLPIIRYLLRTFPENAAMGLSDCEHGLWNRMKAASDHAETYAALISDAKTRHYTLTRIQRTLAALLLNLTKDVRDRHPAPRYIRVLGSSAAGRTHLRTLKKNNSLPIINNLARFSDSTPILQEMLDYDILATDLFTLSLKDPQYRVNGADYSNRGPYIGK